MAFLHARTCRSSRLGVVMLTFAAIVAPITLAPDAVSAASAGNLDPTFSGDGIEPLGDETVVDIVVQPDGRVITLGARREFVDSDPRTSITLRQFNPDGTPDLSFGNDGVINHSTDGSDDLSAAMALDPDGNIVVTGTSRGDMFVARFRPDGSYDLSFGQGAPERVGYRIIQMPSSVSGANALVLLGDGSIVLGGWLRADGMESNLVAKVDENGDLVPDFGTNGVTEFTLREGRAERVTGLLPVPGGAMWFVGHTGDSSYLARMGPGGAVDVSYNDGGYRVAAGTAARYNAIAEDLEGGLLVAGTAGGEVLTGYVQRFTPTGGVDDNFGFGGAFELYASKVVDVFDVATDNAGRILFSGALADEIVPHTAFVQRLTRDGFADHSFGEGSGFAAENFGLTIPAVHGIAVEDDDDVVAVASTSWPEEPDAVVARFLGGDTVEPSDLPAIVFHQDTGEGNDLQFISPAGADLTDVALGGGYNSDPEWSPDGTKVAYVTQRNGTPDIYVYDTLTEAEFGVVLGPDIDADPTWSPDGRRLAFATDRNGPSNFDVYEVGLQSNGAVDDGYFDGQAFRAVSNDDTAWESFPRYAPDGRIYYQTAPLSFPLSFDIHTRQLDSDEDAWGEATVAVGDSGDEQGIAASPDGRRLVFSRDGELWESAAVGHAPFERRLTLSDGTTNNLPAYSPDATKVVFVRNSGETRLLSIIDLTDEWLPIVDIAAIAGDGAPHWSWAGSEPPPPPIEVTVEGNPSTEGSEWFRSATVRITGPDDVDYEVSVDASDRFPYPGDSGVPVAGDGEHLVEWWASNGQSGSVPVKIDANAPSISVESPDPDTVYLPGQVVLAAYHCTDGGSGVASCVGTVPDGEPIDTGPTSSPDDPTWSPMVRSFTVDAVDIAGLRSSHSVTYRVKYAFEGFMAPIGNECGTYGDDDDDRPDPDDGPCGVVNVGKAGKNFPIKWRLHDAEGVESDLRVVKQIVTRRVACPDRPASEVDGSTEAPGDEVAGGSLKFDDDEQRFHYQFKTLKAWKGQCRLLSVRIDDGSQHSALFRFT